MSTQVRLVGAVERVELHEATPGRLDAEGYDWNNDTLRFFMASGDVIDVSGGCHGLRIRPATHNMEGLPNA